MGVIINREPVVLTRTKTYTLRALCNQSGNGNDMIRRWQQIEANGFVASNLLAHGQAIEDVEPIGLDCAAANKLSKARLVLLDQLRKASVAELRAAGLSAAEVQKIQAWRGEDGTENPSPVQILDDLVDLPGVGAGTLAKIRGAGIDSLEALAAADDEMLDAMRLGKARKAIGAWRAGQ